MAADSHWLQIYFDFCAVYVCPVVCVAVLIGWNTHAPHDSPCKRAYDIFCSEPRLWGFCELHATSESPSNLDGVPKCERDELALMPLVAFFGASSVIITQ